MRGGEETWGRLPNGPRVSGQPRSVRNVSPLHGKMFLQSGPFLQQDARPTGHVRFHDDRPHCNLRFGDVGERGLHRVQAEGDRVLRLHSRAQ